MNGPHVLSRAVAAMRRGDHADAQAECRRVIAEHGELAEAWHLLGVLAHQAGSPVEAVRHLKRAIEHDPGNAEYQNTLGAVYLAVGHVPEAERALRHAVELRPNYAEAHHNLGLCFERCEDWTKAEWEYQCAVSMKPDYASAHLRLGHLCQRRKDPAAAVASFQRAVELSPRWVEAQRSLGTVLLKTGKLQDAERVLRDASSLEPQSAETWNCLGVVLSRQQRHADAVACYLRALELLPESHSALANLGIAFVEHGKPTEGLPYLEKACEKNPANAVCWNGLMRCRLALKQYAAATAAGQQAVEVDATSVEAFRYLGLSLEHQEMWEDAQAAYQQAIALRAADADVLFAMARVAERLHNPHEAVDYCRRALAVKSDYPGANLFLGQLLSRVSQRGMEQRLPLPQVRDVREEAVLHLKRAVALDPTPESNATLGQAYYDIREHELARRCFEDALSRDPQMVGALISLGNVHSELGDKEAGEVCFDKALEMEPQSARAHFNLAKIRRSMDAEGDINRLRELLSHENVGLQQQVLLHFAIATIADGAGRFDDAFEAYQAGNALKRRPQFLDEQASPRPDEQFVDQLIDVFDAKFFSERCGWGNCTQRPIFVVGVPRSGTTLTEQILSSHPQVYGAGELGDIAYLAHRLSHEGDRQAGHPRGITSTSRERIAAAAAEHDRRLSDLSSRDPYVVDKMPGNFLHLAVIAVLFPEAKIINCRRDPRDVCVSCFRNNLDWPFCDLAEVGRFCGRYERIMQHWHEVLPLQIYDSTYEDLVNDFEPHARALIGHCGLKWDDRCLEFYNTARAVGTPSKWQVRQPIYQSSVGLWKRYQQHLDPLFDALSDCSSEVDSPKAR